MTLLVTIAAIIAQIATMLALNIYLAIRLAKLVRKSRYDCERDDAERQASLEGSTCLHRVHNGRFNSK